MYAWDLRGFRAAWATDRYKPVACEYGRTGAAAPHFGHKSNDKTLKQKIGGVKIVKTEIYLLKRLISRGKRAPNGP